MKKSIILFISIISLLQGYGYEIRASKNRKSQSVLKAPVISYYVEASGEARPKRYLRRIFLYDYGKILIRGDKKIKDCRYLPIAAKRVRSLLNYIVKQQDFFSISKKDIKDFQKQRGMFLDASTTRITIWCRKGVHTISVYNFPSNEKVKNEKIIRLQKIVRKLEKIRTEFRSGK